MAPYRQKVINTLGQSAWDCLMEERGIIKAELVNHKQMNNTKNLSESTEFCAILCYWYSIALYDMKGVDGVQTLIKIFRSNEIRLCPSETHITTLDTIVRSFREIFKKEDHIAT